MNKLFGGVGILLCAACVGGQDLRPAPAPRLAEGRGVSPGHARWEYAVHTRRNVEDLGAGQLTDGLNKLGEDGWELVSVDPGLAGPGRTREQGYYFKRVRATPAPEGGAAGAPAAPSTLVRAGFVPGGAERRTAAAAKEDFQVLTLKHAQPQAVLGVVQQLFAPQGFPGRNPVRVVADERTNSVIVAGTEDQLETVRKLVVVLDQPGPAGKTK